jgi:sulfur-oxidizing protein SoxB
VVKNKGGQTLVTNAGSNGKFLGVMQLDVRGGKVQGYNYRLVPVFSKLLPEDKGMADLIKKIQAPYASVNNEVLARAEETLFRRGNFNGTFDQVICDAQRVVGDAQISLSPGFRWGTTVLPGQDITMANVMDQTCTTYPNTYVRPMKGEMIKLILEDVADNLFNTDPYYQQGGDMVRVGGMDYTIDPHQEMGKRIDNMTLDDGTPIEANKEYPVAGWASVGQVEEGAPIWDVVAEYLRDMKTVKIDKLNTPVIKNVAGNPGIDDYVKA